MLLSRVWLGVYPNMHLVNIDNGDDIIFLNTGTFKWHEVVVILIVHICFNEVYQWREPIS